MAENSALATVSGGLLRVDEAAKFLGVSRSRLYALIARGEIQTAKIGRSRRVPKNALEAFAARSLVGTSTDLQD